MDDSLQALIEKATNPRNKYEDWEFIMSFCDQVNVDPQGPQVALQLIVPKMRDPNEKVCMLTLTLLEACVKNCGQRFHQELGKFRFLNELIRMISPKYLGDVTPPTIKDKIEKMLYSWKLGLPNEGKIQEAYEMLKREGLVFDESAGPDPTLEAATTKPKVTLREDPKQSQILQKLLSSKNPDDLRAANRLIREMVRRDDKRMQRLQKRLGDLELIQNNIKLLSELLAHYSSRSGEQEKSLIKELYRSLDNMRPNLMRMASDLKNNEEGMADILAANESLLRVTDTYKRIFEPSEETPSNGEATEQITTPPTSTAEGGVVNTPLGGGASDSDVLIDLAGLDFGPPPTPVSGATTNSQDGNLSSLIDDLGMLDLPPIGTSQPLPGTQPAQQPLTTMPTLTGPGTTFPTSQPSLFGSFAPPTSMSAPHATPTIPLLNPPPGTVPTYSPALQATPPQQRAPPTQQPSSDPFDGLLLLSTPPQAAAPPQPTPLQVAPPPADKDPLAVLDSINVTNEQAKSIQMADIPPMQVMNKDNVNITFTFGKVSPAPGVTVIIISVLSTNFQPIEDFQFEAAVPKNMRVKLQPPSHSKLQVFNPLSFSNDSSVLSQVMLLANPLKVRVRMKYRVTYFKGQDPDRQQMAEYGDITFPENFNA